MTITYAICVCDEARELDSLLNFLTEVKEDGDDINILVDSGKATDEVRHVLERHKAGITYSEREFDGNFAEHRNHHTSLCKGDYVFVLDADEMPQEILIKNIKQFDGDILAVPRMNICPGATAAFYTRHNFQVTNTGWINWPDFQLRYYKNNGVIKWEGGLHETVSGGNVQALPAEPGLALWHIKSVQKQDKQKTFYDDLPMDQSQAPSTDATSSSK